MGHDEYQHLRESADTAAAEEHGPFHQEALNLVKVQAAIHYNLEYGFKEGDEHAYTPESITMDEIPMAKDATQFVLWLASMDNGELGLHNLSDKEKVYLAKMALEWTGE